MLNALCFEINYLFQKVLKILVFSGSEPFRTLNGGEVKANYFDVDTGEHYWISGCKKDGSDRLYGERLPIYIDEDVSVEYWIEIRNLPSLAGTKVINGRK